MMHSKIELIQDVIGMLENSGWKDYSSTDNCPSTYEQDVTIGGVTVDIALRQEEDFVAFIEVKKDRARVNLRIMYDVAKKYESEGPDGRKYMGKYGVPFIYTTDGDRVIFDDLREKSRGSREIGGFHSPDDLERFLNRDLEGLHNRIEEMDIRNQIEDYFESSETLNEVQTALKDLILENKNPVNIEYDRITPGFIDSILLSTSELGYFDRILYIGDGENLPSTNRPDPPTVNSGDGKSEVYRMNSAKFFSNLNQEYSFGHFDLIIIGSEYMGVRMVSAVDSRIMYLGRHPEVIEFGRSVP